LYDSALFLRETVSANEDQPDIVDKVVSRIKSLIPKSDETALEEKRRDASYDAHVKVFYAKIPRIKTEANREDLLAEIRIELNVAKRVKENPGEYFPDPDRRAVIMRGISKYVSDLERLESKTRNWVIPK
jgi:hypothetical protein